MPFGSRWPKYPAAVQVDRIGRPARDRERGGRGTMSLSQFKSNVETAVGLLSRQKRDDKTPLWLNERAIAGWEGCGFEALSADLAFQLGTAVARFRRIANEVSDMDGVVVPEQSQEAAAALQTIA